ncbi:MAG: hypothetical protein RI904_91 [Pseudomonadota bacterium]
MPRKEKQPAASSLAKLPPIAQRTIKVVRAESFAWSHMFREEWLSILSLIVGMALLVFFWQPIPPKVVGIAAGPKGTSDGIYAEKLVAFFAKNGIKLNITYTEGGKQPIAAMQREAKIQSALILGGLYKKHELDKEAFSLGSSQYEPLWLFYRGDIIKEDQPVLHFATTSGIAVGQPGSGSNIIIRDVLTSGRKKSEIPLKLLEWPYLKSVEALIAGEINALSVVDGIESPVIKRLLADPNIHIGNFPLAPAYVKRLPQLDIVSVPRGSFASEPLFPPIDINMVSTSLTLIVEKDLHPAIQLLFLMAMDEIGDSRDQFFAKQDEFPSYKDSNIPLSPIAQQYFTRGPPAALSYVNFVFASLINRIWFFILSALAILYPLYRLIPNVRAKLGQMKANDAQEMLFEVQARFAKAETEKEFNAVMQDFYLLQNEIDTWIPRISIGHYYGVVGTIRHVNNVAQARKVLIESREQTDKPA